MTIDELASEIAVINSSKGFSFEESDIHQRLLLAVSEICEAYEELRDGRGLNEVYFSDEEPNKPEGFPIEIADAIIRLLHILRNFGVKVEDTIRLKLEYNKTRPMRHGRLF